MKKTSKLLMRATTCVAVAVVTAVLMIGIVPSTGSAAAKLHFGSSRETANVSPLDATTTTTSTTTTSTTTTTTTTDPAGGHPIVDGPSRSECLSPNVAPGESGFAYLQSLITSFENLTDTTVTCISTYLNNAQTWSQWVQPWVTHAVNGYSPWVAQDPQVRQLVLEVNLIPLNLQDVQNPTKWEQACAAGDYDVYATQLGKNLVAAGLGNSVIRLGAEMNGNWEPDFIGTKVAQQRLWAKCFANEVTSLRQAKGESFLIDWNPNACTGDYPFINYYPGNAYVNILGFDLYDVGCMTPYKRLTFTQLANEQLGLSYFEAFAAARGKPMSFPEWGLAILPSGDDPGYIAGMGKAFDTKDFAFEAYFDASGLNIGSLPLGSSTPLSVAAFHQWFGSA